MTLSDPRRQYVVWPGLCARLIRQNLRTYDTGELIKYQTRPDPAGGRFFGVTGTTGLNGTALKGLDPFVAMGNALTKAAATDGRMVFDVTSAAGRTRRKETVTIPVLGVYSKTWPLDCPKSKRIIDEAAAFYSDSGKFKQNGIPGALACLFMLSTGDDKTVELMKQWAKEGK